MFSVEADSFFHERNLDHGQRRGVRSRTCNYSAIRYPDIVTNFTCGFELTTKQKV